MVRQQSTKGLREPTFESNQKGEGEQVGVIENPEEAQKEHKKESLETKNANAEKGKFASEGEITSEHQLENEIGGNVLGFSNHTPIVNKTKSKNSPQSLFSSPSNNFKRYSRARRNQRQKARGCLKQNNLTEITHQQQMVENVKGASPNSGQLGQQQATPVKKDIQPANNMFNSHLVEVEAILKMAKVLGMTDETDNEGLINKIEEMKERDLKEVERLGARIQNP